MQGETLVHAALPSALLNNSGKQPVLEQQVCFSFAQGLQKSVYLNVLGLALGESYLYLNICV